ncbi:HGxxPAAW family protein [Phytoactinopolyspora halotolerans]|uniref:HGxxPAAW family protein n=1 Tax=Phytoactinopolyspora halotolerans TaxID=1981512 RepID=UPI001C205305|nr:HGxxPAAW family protein [Phytoactinopolyspora halotolerans]
MANDDHHGHTPAAWAAVIIIVAGFVVGAIGVMTLTWQVFWFGGVGLMVLGGIVGKVMQMMGLGAERPGSDDESPEQVVTPGPEGRDG